MSDSTATTCTESAETTPTGRFCWHELLTSDPEAASAFYGEVVGWDTGEWSGSGTPYRLWINRGLPIGGLMQLPAHLAGAGVPPHWLLYVSTPDADACARKAESLGGSVLEMVDVDNVGRFAVLKDPLDAVFIAYQPCDATPGHDEPAELGEFSWRELATTDWGAAWAFYSELFGWQEAYQGDMGEMGVYQMFHRGAHPLGGVYNRPPEMPVSAWLNYVRVPDAFAAARRVTELGGTLLNGPMEVPGGDYIAQCLDPQGAAFAVHSTPEDMARD